MYIKMTSEILEKMFAKCISFTCFNILEFSFRYMYGVRCYFTCFSNNIKFQKCLNGFGFYLHIDQ